MSDPENRLRIGFDKLLDTLHRVLLKIGFREDRAALCARLFAETTCDGVYSHGVDRFPRFLRTIENGSVKIDAEPELINSIGGALERWDGNRGPGNLNAYASMSRTADLARQNGIGCLALANTNHWMRGGTYGWQAADAGMIGICWTNTLANLPTWGSDEPGLGNNPLVIGVPRESGHIVLDMAMSQFSFGALESYRKREEPLPVPGGFDVDGNLTLNAAAIEQTGRVLPIGYWKGSGLALVLDLIAATLSGGQATFQIPADPEFETGVSQIFIAIDSATAGDRELLADQVIESMTGTGQKSGDVRYPGERTLQTRRENMKKGVPVDPTVWEEIRTYRVHEGRSN